jgi:hypothetical protein
MSALHATATTSRDVSGRTHRRHCQTRRQVGASHRLAPAGCVPGAGGPGRGRRRSARAPRGQPHGVPRMPPKAPAGHRSGGRTATLRSHRVSSLARGARRPRRHRPHHWQFDVAPFFIEAEHVDGGDLMDWAEAHGGLERIPLSGVQWRARIGRARGGRGAAAPCARRGRRARRGCAPSRPGR